MKKMKMTEKEVAKIAIQVLNDIKWPYDAKKGVRPLETTLEEQYEKYKNFEGFEENKHKVFPYWSVLFDFPEDDGWDGRNVMSVKVKDETGEPYEVGHRQWKGKVIKDENGKYHKENYNKSK
jgi:hypothetical protein